MATETKPWAVFRGGITITIVDAASEGDAIASFLLQPGADLGAEGLSAHPWTEIASPGKQMERKFLTRG